MSADVGKRAASAAEQQEAALAFPSDGSQLAARQLADGFAHYVAQWAKVAGCGSVAIDAVGEAARRVSLATSEGHVCVQLGQWTSAARQDAPSNDTGAARPKRIEASRPALASLRSTLLATGLVVAAEALAASERDTTGATAHGVAPMVLDAVDRLYLHRYYAHEQRLARRLVQAATAPPMPVSDAARDMLRSLFSAKAKLPPADAEDAPDWQQLAVALALRQRLCIVSGGPGTGKTTTVVNLLACLLTESPQCRIALAAPTGKAAARMADAIRSGAAALPEAMRARLPAAASTIHRLLRSNGRDFSHDADNPLPIDVLVVDEASMLDLALADQLLAAVPPDARIVLLGDKDQLAAVEAGSVFSDVCANPTLSDTCRQAIATLCNVPTETIVPPPAAGASAMPDSAIWFTRNFRFAADSGIGQLATLIKSARAVNVVGWLRDQSDAAVQWLDDTEAGAVDAAGRCMQAGYAPLVEALSQPTLDIETITRAFERFRVLCALKVGPRGAAGFNEGATRHVRAAVGNADATPWFTGRPVMVLRNDPVLGLFNGDIGIALPALPPASGDTQGLGDGSTASTPAPVPLPRWEVHFPQADGGFRAIPALRLPTHQTAFAMTVHKSQGSEFDEVLVCLPERPNPVASRELLYTAITRARKRVTLLGSAPVVDAAVRSATRRQGGLLDHLTQAARD